MPARTGFGSEISEDEKGTWLTFTLDDIPIIGVEIPSIGNIYKLFNIFWWGLGTANKLIRVTNRLISFNENLLNAEHREKQTAMPREVGFVRSVCYGSDGSQEDSAWKKIRVTQIGEDPVIFDGTLNIRFEYVPDPNERFAQIISWTRFHSPPDPADVDAIESVGILLPFSVFADMVDYVDTVDPISEFIWSTSVRSARKELPTIYNIIKEQFNMNTGAADG